MVRTLAVIWTQIRAHAILIVVLILFGLAAAQATATSQFCGLAEGVQLEHVHTLERTYDYLGKLEREDLTLTINRVVLANLAEQEREAHRDTAPGICDHFGLGLPEPDHAVPERPDTVSRLYREFTHTSVGRVQTK